MTDTSTLTGWSLTPGGVGNEIKCVGLLEALHINPIIKQVNPKRWYRHLAPIGPAEPHPDIVPPWPDVLIVSGRKALPYARWIKRCSKGRTFVAVLQKPGLPSAWFDFIWTPQHDGLKGKNVCSTLVPPHRISKSRITAEVLQYQPLIEDLPKPWVTVLIGGPSRSFQFGLTEAAQLANDLILLHQKTGCGFLISYSFRTTKELMAYFNHRLAMIPAKIWDMQGNNPFFAYLGFGDFFIVTADSVNMLGEVAFTGKPVYAYPVPYLHNKFIRFYQSMIAHGAMRWFDGNLDTWSYEPLNATPIIAQELRSQLSIHQAKINLPR